MGCSHPQTASQPLKTDQQAKLNSATKVNPQPQGEKNKPTQAIIQKKQDKKQKQVYNNQNFSPELDAFINSVFQKYDVNKTGALQMNEFSRLLREQINPDVVSEQEAEKFLKIADLNKNQVIQKNELKTLYTTLIKY